MQKNILDEIDGNKLYKVSFKTIIDAKNFILTSMYVAHG
jgi:hypothetical protein